MRNLERALGIELLSRTARGVVPTNAGARLYEYAVRITDDIRRAEEEVRQAADAPFGTVSFGMPASISMALSIPLAETIRVEMPGIRFRAAEAMSGHIKEWLRSGEIDLALVYDLEGLGDCTARLVLREDLWFYAAPDDWPLATPPGEPTSLDQLAGLQLTLPSQRHGLRAIIDRVAVAHGVELNVVTEMDALQQIKQLVSRGSGYTILSQAAVLDFVPAGHLVGSPIREPEIRRPVHLVRSAVRPFTAAAYALEALCLEVIVDLVERGIWQAELTRETLRRRPLVNGAGPSDARSLSGAAS